MHWADWVVTVIHACITMYWAGEMTYSTWVVTVIHAQCTYVARGHARGHVAWGLSVDGCVYTAARRKMDVAWGIVDVTESLLFSVWAVNTPNWSIKIQFLAEDELEAESLHLI